MQAAKELVRELEQLAKAGQLRPGVQQVGAGAADQAAAAPVPADAPARQLLQQALEAAKVWVERLLTSTPPST